MKRSMVAFILILGCALIAGCKERPPVKRSWGRMKGLEKIVGNMNDMSYSTVRNKPPRLNALGEQVNIASFEGRFLWAEYVASWCKACSWQTPQTKKAGEQIGDVDFLTIMTGKSQQYNDHATVTTAKSWASRYGLEPARVLAAELWFKIIPEHRLFSPNGQTLFVHVGVLSSEQIREVVEYYRLDWGYWSETGEPASWMSFQ